MTEKEELEKMIEEAYRILEAESEKDPFAHWKVFGDKLEDLQRIYYSRYKKYYEPNPLPVCPEIIKSNGYTGVEDNVDIDYKVDEIGLEKKIEKLKADLSAETVIQEERSIYGKSTDKIEEYMLGIGANYFNSEGGWVIDLPEIKVPDIKKREAARRELHRIYESLEEGPSKKGIEEALKIKDSLEELLKEIEKLKQELNSEMPTEKEEVRKRLKEIYENSNNPITRYEAGRTMGYSKTEIWMKEMRGL